VETLPPPSPTHTPLTTISLAAVNVVPSNCRLVEPVTAHVPVQYVTKLAAPEPVTLPAPVGAIEEVLKYVN
jgi:hypothetical protein